VKIHQFEDDPLIAEVLAMQKAFSLAQSESDIMFSFASNFHSISGSTHIIDLSVKNLRSGQFRAMNRIWIADPELDLDRIMQFSLWNEPREKIQIQTSEIVSQVLLTPLPKYVEYIEPGEDSFLQGFITETSSMMAVPIYHHGEVTEWILLFTAAGRELQPGIARLGIANINLVIRSMFQIRLHNEVKQLHQTIETQLSQVKHLHQTISGQLNEVIETQQGLLPTLPAEDHRIAFSVNYSPCEEAGGDYYDFTLFDENKIGIVVADVSGHGPRAAVIMSMLRALFAAHRRYQRPPEMMIDDVNKVLFDITDGSTFITAFFVIIDLNTGQAKYANAGHPPALWFTPKKQQKHYPLAGSPPLGIMENMPMQGGEFTLLPGDRLMIFTDGITEACDEQDSMYGVEGLVADYQNQDLPFADIAANIIAQVEDYSQRAKRHDDKCILLVEFKGEDN
jgi:sigma-B regulation protein RsbU (phosphoserine phosphatase)